MIWNMLPDVFGNADTRMFRRMGYFDDQSGIIRRYRRESVHWNTHLQNTRLFALQTMQSKNCRSAAVLGSGWLLDVPVEELSRRFENVYLYDIRHPAAVRKQIQPLGNVELRVCDISCYARPVYQYVRQYRSCKKRPPIHSIQPLAALDVSGIDFVFSCNILNQLDILLIDYLTQFFDLTNEETIMLRSNIQQHHIDLLPCNCSCLVADYEEITCTSDGKEIARRISVHHPVTHRPDAKRWTWEFDTKMTYSNNGKTSLRVLGVAI